MIRLKDLFKPTRGDLVILAICGLLIVILLAFWPVESASMTLSQAQYRA